MVLVNATKKTVVSDNCHFANTVLKRMVGLLNRGQFDKGEGLLLDRCYGIHTFGMRFPIDVAFCDAEMVVVGMARLPPWRMSRPRRRCRSVVEAEAGAFERWGLRVGDKLDLRG